MFSLDQFAARPFAAVRANNPGMQTTSFSHAADTLSLLDALLRRRSRRFGPSMRLEGGPLSYASQRPPQPLSIDEEASLAFAACGITGYALAELPYAAGREPESGGGNIMTHFIGRTVPSGDAMHYNAMFVINDQGAWMLKRPQDYSRGQISELIRLARERRFVELYDHARIRIADARVDVPRCAPFVPTFNKWSANVPGTTYFLPVSELSALYINILLTIFDDEYRYFIVDERNGFAPAGLERFSRSRGGHLDDDPAAGRVAPIGLYETWLCEFAALEQGCMMQNLGLMAEALQLGGFPHFAAHPFIWPQQLGFRMEQVQSPAGPMPTPVGLERDGDVLLRPYCPPYYRSMEEAVLAFVDYKFAAGSGTLRDATATGWRDPASVQAGIPPYSDRAIEATIAYCTYVHSRYGRFPAASGPFRTVLAYQAHHLDTDFYDRFYRPEATGR